MADETEITEPETPETSGTPAPGGLKAKLPLIGGVLAGLLLGSGTGLFFLGPKLAPASPAPHTTAKGSEGKDGEDKGEGKKDGEHGKAEAAPMYQIDNLVLNPAGSNGTRFLLLSVALELKNDAALELLKAHDAELRDTILRMFGAKTAEQVSEASARDGLRAELIATIAPLFPAGTVSKAYFPQFVIQ